MSKKTLLLIIALSIVTVTLIYLAIKSENKDILVVKEEAPQTAPQTVQKTTPKTAKISFFPETIDGQNSTSSFISDIYVESATTLLTGVQIELTYDPTVVTSVQVLPPTTTPTPVKAVSFFGQRSNWDVIKNDTKTVGKVSYWIAILPQGKPVSGVGSVGKLLFQLKKTVAPGTPLFQFQPNTLVTAEDVEDSVLKEAVPLSAK